jgi:hypothetical protein
MADHSWGKFSKKRGGGGGGGRRAQVSNFQNFLFNSYHLNNNNNFQDLRHRKKFGEGEGPRLGFWNLFCKRSKIKIPSFKQQQLPKSTAPNDSLSIAVWFTIKANFWIGKSEQFKPTAVYRNEQLYSSSSSTFSLGRRLSDWKINHFVFSGELGHGLVPQFVKGEVKRKLFTTSWHLHSLGDKELKFGVFLFFSSFGFSLSEYVSYWRQNLAENKFLFQQSPWRKLRKTTLFGFFFKIKF